MNAPTISDCMRCPSDHRCPGDDCREIRLGSACIGTIKPADGGWYAYPEHDAPASWHPYERDAVQAVARAHRQWVASAGQITQPTVRHLQVLAAYADGGRRPSVARELRLSESTVASYLVDIRQRLGARTTCHAVALAYECGLLPAARATLPAPQTPARLDQVQVTGTPRVPDRRAGQDPGRSPWS